MFFYSFKFKRVVLFGNFVVAFSTGLAFVFAGSVVENIAEALIPALFAFLINFGREIMKDIEDMEGDLKCGVRTFPMVCGVKRAVAVINFVFAVLILFTFVPYFLNIYSWRYLAVVSLGVDTVLIFVMLSLLKDISRENLKRLSNILKFDMIVGLVAIYIG